MSSTVPISRLNVSRSFLQNDREVQKISRHITKKVADKLTGLFKNDREKFVQCWNDISVFIKVGCLKDEDFYSKVKDILIFKDLNGEYKNLDEFLGVVPRAKRRKIRRTRRKNPFPSTMFPMKWGSPSM